ncbi:outer membrane protein, cobalt-zinc-cadmium efflux system [Dyadobacter koreensis]|uniref:Outer membrane protein, cobalt-zinc-cadmium efflux system n=1 Tax=Dyadobacter koreensis TaxID=408657 RepID=A0A1H6RVI5_9BACT|nr:TolC family protein [Dyadobacter koreensis]SEI55202.1 outer membrane protein, cobalt-zinc-cadmium efflux system [Dyadobacter koreensis]
MRTYVTGLLLLLSLSLRAQDTLRLNIRQADSIFLQHNLQLLAEKYQIDISKSQEIQDKLWANPTLGVEISAYNPSRGFLDVGRQGQKAITIQQLITRAGKRNKRVALDVESTRKSEFQFYDLIRTLKFELREIFFESYFLNQTIALYDTQIATLNTTVSAFDKEYDRKNISLKEVVRLKALLFQLTNDRADILFELAENQRDLKTLLNSEVPIKSIVDSSDINRYQLKNYNLSLLKDRALQSRSDLKVVQSETKQSELNYTLQKALAVPDIQIGGIYDQSSNYVSNYFGLNVSIDLPFFNRNQGNIRAAKSNVSYFKTLETAKQSSISNEVNAALQKVFVAEKAYKSVENHFTDQFELLSKGFYDNFQKRNITLLEFIDFIETYNESIKEFNRLQADRIKVYEELNFVVGEELFN